MPQVVRRCTCRLLPHLEGMLPCCVHPACVFGRGGELRAITHKLVTQVHHASTTHSGVLYMCIITHRFSSAEYGIKIGIVTKTHDKLGKPGDLEHEDVLGKEREERKEN